MIERYIVAGPYEIDGITGVHNDIVVGLISPTALAGFGHKIQLELAKTVPTAKLQVTGTSAVIHKWSKLDGHPKFPPPTKDATKGAPILDEVKLRSKISFIFSARCDIDPEDVDPADIEESVSSFLSVNMIKYGYGGGRLFLDRATLLAAKYSIAMIEADKLTKYLGRLPGGSVLFDRHDLLAKHTEFQGDSLDRILHILTRRKEPSTGKYASPVKGFIVPINVGFQALENPVARANPRIPSSEQRHVYAESISSLGEFKSLRSLIRKKDGNPFDGSFWTHYSNPETGTYYVSASGAI